MHMPKASSRKVMPGNTGIFLFRDCTTVLLQTDKTGHRVKRSGAAVIVLQGPQCHHAWQITSGTGVKSMAPQEVQNPDTKKKLLESSLAVIDYTVGGFLCITLVYRHQ